MKLLSSKGANINKVNGYRYTPLGLACKKEHLEIVILLISNVADADINKKNRLGDTPINMACKNGNLEIVKLLILNSAADIINKVNDLDDKNSLDI